MTYMLAIRSISYGIFAGLGSHVVDLQPDVLDWRQHILVGVAVAGLIFSGSDPEVGP